MSSSGTFQIITDDECLTTTISTFSPALVPMTVYVGEGTQSQSFVTQMDTLSFTKGDSTYCGGHSLEMTLDLSAPEAAFTIDPSNESLDVTATDRA